MAGEADRVAVVGAGGHARVVAEALSLRGVAIAGHVAPEAARDETLLGPHLGGDEAIAALAAEGFRFALGLGFVDGAGAARRDAVLRRIPPELLVTVLHPASTVSPSALLGAGGFIAAGAILGCGAVTGTAAILNTGCIVDHNCRIGHNVHIATGARLGGAVTVGDSVLIGLGATVRQGVTIGSGAVVGAGAVVVADVAVGALVVGNPARPRGV